MRLGGLSVKAFCCVAAACARVKSFELNLEWNRVFAPLYPLVWRFIFLGLRHLAQNKNTRNKIK